VTGWGKPMISDVLRRKLAVGEPLRG